LERLALIARLKPGTEQQAQYLIMQGPPFDPGETGFVRHSVFLSATEIVFIFEAHEVEWLVNALIENPFQWMVEEELDKWRPLVEGTPRIAREKFFWERSNQ
jgi:hypothetical protein